MKAEYPNQLDYIGSVNLHCSTCSNRLVAGGNAVEVLQSFPLTLNASLAQLVARRSHNPKVVSSILTGGTFGPRIYRLTKVCIFLQRAKSWKWLQLLPWSSGYDARLTRERSPVQSREEVLQSVF